MKKKYLNLLTISCGILLMSVPAGYAAEGDDEDPFLGITGCASGHYYRSTVSCHRDGGGFTPEAPETHCNCVIEDGEWGHWYCCDATNTGGGGGGGGHGGNTPHGGITGGTSGGSSNDGCDIVTGKQKQCCKAGFDRHGSDIPLHGCSSDEVFMGECPLDYLWWRCLDYEAACEVMGYSTSTTSCPTGEQEKECPYNWHLDANNKHYKCQNIPCYGKEKCTPVDGKNPIGCKNNETPCYIGADIYCSGTDKCKYPSDTTTCSMGDTPRVRIDDLDDDIPSIDCQTNEDGMRNCDALGYLQTASECANATRKLKCPFDENRYFCGGKISSPKICSPIFTVNGSISTAAIAAFTGNTQTGLSDCNGIDDIVLHNMCIRRFCDSCHIRKSQDEYCVSASSYPIYKLTCESDAICPGDENGDVVGVDGPDNSNPQNQLVTCSDGEFSDNGVCRKCPVGGCNLIKKQ